VNNVWIWLYDWFVNVRPMKKIVYFSLSLKLKSSLQCLELRGGSLVIISFLLRKPKIGRIKQSWGRPLRHVDWDKAWRGGGGWVWFSLYV